MEHKHIIIRAEVNKPPQDIRKVKKWLRKLVKAIGMRPLGRPTAVYVDTENNKGITAVQCIETSHIALHCWDEVSPAIVQLDVYTCGSLDKEIVFPSIISFLASIMLESEILFNVPSWSFSPHLPQLDISFDKLSNFSLSVRLAIETSTSIMDITTHNKNFFISSSLLIKE